ncbi:hypothetical protein [Thioalkalivibrio sp. AKL19]|uniref:hypothetical protein n=1 Tax=Thioalkalivibrio sp. AKL19 TaxID=1266914 RepID=UPI000402E451|nr:hypothetical protein [Thioalkalivibrio sp. AKL19]
MKKSGTNPPREDEMNAIVAAIEQSLAQDSPGDRAERDAVVAAAVAEVNARPLDDFAGLSPEQMGALLYSPFEHPELVSFAEGVAECPTTVMSVLFRVLADTIRAEGGIPLTPKGNLPLRVVADAWAAVEAAGLEPEWHPGSRRKEDDFPELHVTRLLVQMSGLGRKYRGRLQLTRSTQQKIERGDWASIFRELLRWHTREFNWAYQDGYPPLPTVQQGALFSLYLLARFGDEWRPVSFYIDAFERAFPVALDEADEYDGPFSAQEVLRNVWPLRTFMRFAHPFGLIEERDDPDEPDSLLAFERTREVRKSAFYDQAVTWKVPG